MGEKDYLNGLKAKRAELARLLATLMGPHVTAGLRPGEHEVRVHDLQLQIPIQDTAIKVEEARLYAQGL